MSSQAARATSGTSSGGVRIRWRLWIAVYSGAVTAVVTMGKRTQHCKRMGPDQMSLQTRIYSSWLLGITSRVVNFISVLYSERQNTAQQRSSHEDFPLRVLNVVMCS